MAAIAELAWLSCPSTMAKQMPRLSGKALLRFSLPSRLTEKTSRYTILLAGMPTLREILVHTSIYEQTAVRSHDWRGGCRTVGRSAVRGRYEETSHHPGAHDGGPKSAHGQGAGPALGRQEDPPGFARLRDRAVLYRPGRGGHHHGRGLPTPG